MGAWLNVVTLHGFGVYRPAQRTRTWQQEVAAQVAGVTIPLLTLSAACLGTQLTLSTDNLPFGTVVLGSEVSSVCVICLQGLFSLLGATVWRYLRLVK